MYTVCIPTFINSLHQDRTDETGLPVSSNRNYMYVVFTSCMNIKKIVFFGGRMALTGFPVQML